MMSNPPQDSGARPEQLAGGEESFFKRRTAAGRSASVPPLPGASLHVGQRIGPFTLRRYIDRGGMGQVWEAWDEGLRRAVALKLVLPERVDVRGLKLFAREARAGGRLAHPNLVTTLAYGTDAGLTWIAQELIEGSWTLKDFLDELRAADAVPKGYYPQVAGLAAQLADALHAAHGAGVIHRDVKPQNVLIAPDDRPKLTDFGLARVMDDSVVSISGDLAGTYAYMSPEQVAANRMGLDHRTDIFSLGIVLYELLTLHRPFEGDTTHQIAAKIIAFDPPHASRIRSQCPRELGIIAGRALEKDPDRRYQTMAEFAADLRRYLGDEPIHAKPPSTMTRAIKWSKRNPALSSAGAMALLALIVVSSLLFVQARTATALARSNLDLEAQTRLAAASVQSARRAQRESEQLAADVLSLSAQKDLDDLVAEAQTLWPAHPAMIPAYEDWLRRAGELIEGKAADEARGIQQRPSLTEQEAQLLELRTRARPLTEEQVKAERASHPRLAELEAKEAQLTWRSRMLGLEAWPSEAEVEADLAKEALPSNASAINSLAWRLVSPELPIYGQEQRALLLAQRAVAAAGEADRAAMRDTLAWALFRLGRFNEALVEERTALAEPGAKAFGALDDSAANLEQAVAAWRGAEAPRRSDERDALAAEVAELRATVNERRTFEYDDSRDAWWAHQLSKLVADLEALRNPKTGLMGDTLAEPVGWGVTKRCEFAKSIAERSIEGAEAKRLWGETVEAIHSSPKYGGLVLAPQMGLLPIGMDPVSQLFEFAHLQTGDPAVRGADGKLLLTEAMGLVFVLIPGGAFWMGSQAEDPNGRNYDPQAHLDESPVHEVELSPYFLSKYEMTQGQWARVAAHNPSYYQPPNRHVRSLLHPVEVVSWPDCMALMERLGLSLPSEAQWENGARGGTSTAWWTGQERESLRGKVNLADRTAKQAGNNLSASDEWPDLEDGGVVHTEVGHYPANGFGLHEVAGNVCEWCLDGFERSGGGGAKSTVRAYRGGSFANAASGVRSADIGLTPEGGLLVLGLRPARGITP